MLLTPRRDVGLGKTMAYLVCNSHRLSQFLSSFVCLRRRVDVRALYVGTVVRSWCVCGRSTSHCHDTVATFVSGDCLRGEDLFRTGRSFPPRWVSWRAKVVTQGGSAARLCMRPSCRGMGRGVPSSGCYEAVVGAVRTYGRSYMVCGQCHDTVATFAAGDFYMVSTSFARPPQEPFGAVRSMTACILGAPFL